MLDWFRTLSEKAQAKCLVRLERLAALGHELRRPEADYLRNGIHELRAKNGGVHHRMLYFFSGGNAVVSHGITKQRAEVPAREIDLALARKRTFEHDPTNHTHEERYP